MGLVIAGGGSFPAIYRPVVLAKARADAITTGTYIIGIDTTDAPVAASNARAVRGMFYFDPADHAVAGKTTNLRLRLAYAVNATAPVATFTAGLYPVSAPAGAAATVTLTLGTVTANSTAAAATPAANAIGVATSSAFAAPVAGNYVIGVVIDANMAANSSVGLSASLQVFNS